MKAEWLPPPTYGSADYPTTGGRTVSEIQQQVAFWMLRTDLLEWERKYVESSPFSPTEFLRHRPMRHKVSETLLFLRERGVR